MCTTNPLPKSILIYTSTRLSYAYTKIHLRSILCYGSLFDFLKWYSIKMTVFDWYVKWSSNEVTFFPLQSSIWSEYQHFPGINSTSFFMDHRRQTPLSPRVKLLTFQSCVNLWHPGQFLALIWLLSFFFDSNKLLRIYFPAISEYSIFSRDTV